MTLAVRQLSERRGGGYRGGRNMQTLALLVLIAVALILLATALLNG